jgi:hypothetical protein
MAVAYYTGDLGVFVGNFVAGARSKILKGS